jgi:hypothetical protein
VKRDEGARLRVPGAVPARLAWRAPLLLSLALVLAGRGVAAAADDRRVVLIIANAVRSRMDEIETRVRGELQAAGFELTGTFAHTGAAWRESVAETARARGQRTLGIATADDLVELEICVFDGNVRRTTGQRLPLASVPASRRAAVIAVVAVDLLKTTLARPTPPATTTAEPPKVAPEPRPPAPPLAPTTPAAAVVARAVPAPTPSWRPVLALGGGWLQAGRASSWAPHVSLTARGSRFGARATLSAFDSGPEVSAEAGTARLSHTLALGELMAALPLARGLDLMVGAGAGGWRLAVDGRGAPGFAGSTTAVWSPVAVAGLGAVWTITPRLALALDARLLAAGTATVVRVDGDEVARVGRPLVWITASVGVRL